MRHYCVKLTTAVMQYATLLIVRTNRWQQQQLQQLMKPVTLQHYLQRYEQLALLSGRTPEHCCIEMRCSDTSRLLSCAVVHSYIDNIRLSYYYCYAVSMLPVIYE
jgi:hypothetical protein